MKYLVISLIVIIAAFGCGYKSPYPTKPGLKFSSVETNHPTNKGLLSFVDTSGDKLIVIRLSYTVNLTKVPSSGIVLKSIDLMDQVGGHPDRNQMQDLPSFGTKVKPEDVDDGILQVTVNAKKWWNHVTTPGKLDSVRYKAVVTDLLDRKSDTVDIPTVYLQY